MTYDHSGAWLLSEDGKPEMNGSKISIEKYMITILWGVYDFYFVDLFPHRASYDSDYFKKNILLQLLTIKGLI